VPIIALKADQITSLLAIIDLPAYSVSIIFREDALFVRPAFHAADARRDSKIIYVEPINLASVPFPPL
jgi:hypothetical protein